MGDLVKVRLGSGPERGKEDKIGEETRPKRKYKCVSSNDIHAFV